MDRSKRKFFKIAFLKIAGFFTSPFVLLGMVLKLFYKYKDLKESDIIILCEEGGFGHTITAPDIARRVYKGKNIVLIFLSEYKRHNRKSVTIWNDLKMFFVSVNYGITWQKKTYPFISIIKKTSIVILIKNVIRKIVGDTKEIISIFDLYEKICSTDSVFPQEYRISNGLKWPYWYIDLQEKVHVSKVRLPDKWRRMIRAKLKNNIGEGSNIKWLCGLYLRQKGNNSLVQSDSIRDGSPLEQYLPAIRFLIKKGYQVLLSGEETVNTDIDKRFDGKLVDYKTLGVERDYFNLFCATEVDCFIGESGGGFWLPGINAIPRLLLNGLPYCLGFPNTFLYFKIIRDNQGRIVPYKELFEKHAFDYDFQGLTVETNTEEQISEAVESFVKYIHDGSEYDIQKFYDELPNYIWSKKAKSIISPAWLAYYRRNERA